MAGFMAGFGTTLSNLIEEDRKYYRDAAAKRRDYIQTYGTRAVVERENQANAALSVANSLISRGFSKDYVTSIAANSGVLALGDLAKDIESRTDLTKDDIAEIESSAKDFVKANPDQDLDTVIKRAYGLYKGGKDPVERKSNLFGAMLGLDARTMEQDVLNEMYLNGYTGKDIYRIMGSAGPKPGKPLGVTLPPKALSLANQATVLNEIVVPAFETNLELEKAKYQAIIDDPNADAASKDNANKLHKELLTIEDLAKTDKGGAIATFISNKNFANAAALTTALQNVESNTAGSILKNTFLGLGFQKTFKQVTGDAQDDAAADDTAAPITTTTPKAGEPGSKANPIKITAQEFDTGVESGTLKDGSVYSVDGKSVTYKAEPASVKSKSKMNFDVMTEAPALGESPISPEFVAPYSGIELAPKEVSKVENAFDPVVADEQNLTVQDQAELRFQAIDSLQKKAGRAVIGTMEVLDDIGAIVERKTQQAYWKANDYMATGLGFAAQTLGFEDTAKALYEYGIKNRNAGSETPLWSETINNWLDSVGVADFTEGKNLPTKEPKSDEVQTNTAKAAVEEIFKNVANMSAEEKEAKVEEIKAVAKAYKESLKDYNPSAAALYGKAQDTETGGGTFSSKKNTSMETKTEVEKQARDLTGYPVVGMPKDADEVVSDRAQPATPESEAAPSVNVADMGLEGLLTKRDRGQSLMSRPKEVEPESAPKLGGAEFQALLARVHGSDSKVSTDFQDKVSSGKIKAADVTRLIKSTQGLPKTKSRDTLLVSLFDLRDALNKR